MGLKEEAEQWMKERYVSNITATEYQNKAAETAIFPKDKMRHRLKNAFEYQLLR